VSQNLFSVVNPSRTQVTFRGGTNGIIDPLFDLFFSSGKKDQISHGDDFSSSKLRPT